MKTRPERSHSTGEDSPSGDSNLRRDSDHDLWVLFDQSHFAVTRSRLLELAQYDLTKEQAQILYALKIWGGSATMNQIASFTLRQRHSVSTLVNRMEKAGLVKKIKVPKEKVYKVTMTKKGKDRYEGVTRDSIEMVFSSLSAEDKQKLASYLNQLHKKARSLLGLDLNHLF